MNIFRWSAWRLCAVLIAAAVSALPAPVRAEDGLTYLETAGRYADLEREAEQRLASGARADATLLSYLCISYGKLKQYEKLFACATRLEQATRSGDVEFALDSHWMFANASDARPLPEVLRARAYFELGQYPQAISSANRVLELLQRIPDTGGLSLYPMVRYQVLALEVIGVSAVRIGDPELAKRTEQQLEDVSVPLFGMRMWKWSKNAAITQVYMAMGQYQEALDHIPDTLPAIMSLIISGLGPYAYRGDDINTILDLPNQVMRGKALSEMGRKTEAKSIFDKLLASPRLRDMGDLYWVALFERGRIAETEGRTDQAAAYYSQAVDVVELQRSSVTTEASKIGFVGDKQVLYKRLVAALIAQGRTAEAFDYIERSKSRALVDMLASKKDFAVTANDSTKIRDLLVKVEQAETAADGPNAAPVIPDSARPASPIAPMSGQRNFAVSAVKQAVADMPPELASLVSVSSTPIEEIQARIPEDEVLVEYYYDDVALFIFVLSHKGLQMVRADETTLAVDVKALRSALEDAGSDAYMPLAQKLYRKLVEPIEPLLGTHTKLIIVPQGVLHYLPFAALNDGRGSFLLDKYAFRLLPSASVLKYLRGKPPTRQGGIFAFGNPDLGDPKYDLKFAEEEAKAIIQTVPRSRVVLRKDATEAALRENASGFNYLHFATHGTFNADAPLESALILAKDASSDGLLTVSKLYSIRLDVDLATLSACETGLGKVANGDDVVGLTRGFLFAGASTIVASLWQVDDLATSELMSRFYALLSGKDKREALREAQLATRQKFPHPFFWAAFQLTGNAI